MALVHEIDHDRQAVYMPTGITYNMRMQHILIHIPSRVAEREFAPGHQLQELDLNHDFNHDHAQSRRQLSIPGEYRFGAD